MTDHEGSVPPGHDAEDRRPWRPAEPIDLGERDPDLALELTAAILAIQGEEPVVLIARVEGPGLAPGAALPSGIFHPGADQSLEASLRAHLLADIGLEIGDVEQLTTLASAIDRTERSNRPCRTVTVGYLALMLAQVELEVGGFAWVPVYNLLPWEDWRRGRPPVLSRSIEPFLKAWAAMPAAEGEAAHPLSRAERLKVSFGLDGGNWDDERVNERLELLVEAGLFGAAGPDGVRGAQSALDLSPTARALPPDHRQIVAAALGRLRAKIRSRPVVFELMMPEFTLFELQRTVEAVLGPHLHKQNFRRLVEGMRLVEETGDVRTNTGGRPAKLFRFRRDVILERPSPGVRVRAHRGL